ncbi:hypothetical protein [Corynebacterium anserum]|uniref:Uncharacterized protein n=1 Tax=Corynebacterium anserum TaxID=2684406 RepID=A0A7G7YQA7_9CORY|nr:hypothetical protein [Corynebacterium anserum]MBC2682357.1 hypothetical protein [Corynebacterium anserum]QNH96677.1 hypothetical protein GP473_08465 [Corynebacterium anserum]
MSLPKELHVEHLYKEGYVPSSFDAPHSSLHRSITWFAMGCILASLSGFGTMLWGLSTMTRDFRNDGSTFAIIGAVLGFGLLFLGFFLVHVGRKNYRDYKTRSGRIH